MRSRTTCAAVSLALWAAVLPAQRYSFKRYDQNAGLAEQNVHTLLQDRTGFLWIGTDNGLYRYDGRRFRAFTKDDGLPAAGIEALHQTPDGTLWVATLAGLARLRGERFETVDISPGKGAVAVTSDFSGRLYVGTWLGLLIGESASLSSPSTKGVFRLYTVPARISQVVRGIAVPESGPVWFACGQQLCRLDHGHVVSLPEWGVPDDLWQAVLIDSRGSVWARSRTMLIELPKDQSRFLRRDLELPPAFTQGTLFASKDGQLWVPTLRGLARHTPAGWDIVGKARGLPISSVQCGLEDREGSIWIGLNGGGLVRWLGFPHWESWTETEGLSSESVWQIRRDRNGVLWSATDTGISRFDPESRHWADLKMPGLPTAQTGSLETAPDGSLWAGQVGGVVHVDFERGVATMYGKESGITYPWISSVRVDAQGVVWVCTPRGLYRGVSSGGKLRFEHQDLPVEPGTDYLTDSLIDSKGRLWVCGWSGLLRLDEGHWTRFTPAQGLLQIRLRHLGEGADGSLWVAYADALGVSRLFPNGKQPAWRHYNARDGLRSLKVVFVRRDLQGRMWVGTDQGLDVFDGGSWRHFDHTDGLVWDDVNGRAFWADADGSVWIGTSRGISLFRIPPSGLPGRPSAAPVMLTSAVLGDRSILSTPPASVSWSRRSLDVGFTAMTFVNEDTVRFRYRMSRDEPWTETQLGEAHIPSLPAGSYAFEVQADAGPGDWAEPPREGAAPAATLAFTVRPAWWRTWWFDLGLLGFTALLAHQLWAWRLRSVLRRQTELEEAVADRTRNLELAKANAERQRDVVEKQKQEIEYLFREARQAARLKDEFLSNMSHELRTPMNGIIGMTELVLDTSLDQDQREYLNVVHSSSDSLLRIIDDVLDFSSLEQGTLEFAAENFDPHEIVEAAAHQATARARQKHLELFCSVDPGVSHRLCGDSARLRQVLDNLLSNAVKFTERGTVTLHVRAGPPSEKPLLYFEVADTGIGISPAEQSFIFEPFSQGDGSMTRRYGGTGLGLAICARFVEMMEGRIWVESQSGVGSRFHFTAQFSLPTEPVQSPAKALDPARQSLRANPSTNGGGVPLAAGAPREER